MITVVTPGSKIYVKRTSPNLCPKPELNPDFKSKKVSLVYAFCLL